MRSTKKFFYYSLGCKLNTSETEEIVKEFIRRGYILAEKSDNDADVVFINTCTVTNKADVSCRNIIRRARREFPNAKIVVAGCFVQINHQKVEEIDEVDLALGTHEKFKVFDYLENENIDRKVEVSLSSKFIESSSSSYGSRTRAFLKIQDGCEYFCSYCIIPYARGGYKSLGPQKIINSIKDLAGEGFKEIVLTGINLGEYKSLDGKNLAGLLEILAKEDAIERIRISSIEPNTINREILNIIRSYPVILNYFHIPLQSGDNSILEAMKRRYDTNLYQSKIELVKEFFPKSAIGTDVIVGFPGETNKNFENTYKFIEGLPLTHFHIFPYSSRTGTVASGMIDQVDKNIKKERAKLLTKLGNCKLDQFCEGLVGQESEVLYEYRNEKGYFEGFTKNYLRVHVLSDEELRGKIIKTKIKKYCEGILIGQLTK